MITPKSPVCFFIPLVLLIIGPQKALGEEKGGLWQSTSLSLPFYEIEGLGDTTLKFENANRWSDGSSHYELNHYQGSWEIPFPGLDNWTWEPAYRRTVNNPGDRDQQHVDRYLLNLNYEKESLFGSEWDLKFRNRWEILDPENDADQTIRGRFRGRLERDIPGLSTEGRSWRFWVSEEMFYDFDRDLFSQNRVATGVEIPLFEDFEFSFGFQWEASRSNAPASEWEDDHMFLVEFRYNLPDIWVFD